MLRKTQNEVLKETTLSLSHHAQKNEVTAKDVYVTDGEVDCKRGTRETSTFHYPTKKCFVQFRLCCAHTNISLQARTVMRE